MNNITKPYEQLQPGTAVTYEGLPTHIISGPRDIMGVDVVWLAYVPHYVPVTCKDLAIMATPRKPTPEEVAEHHSRNIRNKNYPV